MHFIYLATSHLVITCIVVLLDQLDLVAIWIFNKCNYSHANFHWASFTHHITATRFNLFTRLVSIIDCNCDMTIGITQFIAVCIPVMRQFKYGVILFIAITHKSQGKTALFVITLTKQSHAQYFSIELERLFYIAYT